MPPSNGLPPSKVMTHLPTLPIPVPSCFFSGRCRDTTICSVSFQGQGCLRDVFPAAPPKPGTRQVLPKSWLLSWSTRCGWPWKPAGPAEMVATQQQMNDAQLVLQQRDYCAHHLIRLLKCKRDSFPNFLACKHERHAWDHCEHLDYVMRMKEFERERRLLQRKKRREQREADAARGQGPGEVDPEVAL
uniref:NADH dehydrogenase [ubiquinone] 1 beta subcomplex subunit 7 n=1 Tax=Equus asinus TaxID=9793 RepID=A0A9L0JX89_EQUAS|nr:NADH dehydrogenase [ubiquinone] 1 beta subcomplex subunit 7 isoform X1 [Equus asinus]